MNQSDSNWVGGFTSADTHTCVRVHYEPKKKITLDIPAENMHRVVPAHFSIGASCVYIELVRGSQRFVFDGQIDGNTISGGFNYSGEEGTFILFRVSDIDPPREYFGTYRLESGRVIQFGKRWGNMVYLEERRIVDVYPLSDTEFFSEAGEKITFTTNEKGIVLTIHQKGIAVSGTQVTLYTEEEVTFCNRDVTLSGTIAVPSAEGLHPAVVLVHGSGAEDREGYRFLADYLARHNVAALRYDKRGTGNSTGDWHYSSLMDLAEDAAAGVRALQAHDSINPRKIGLLGTSQGGWVVPIAASYTKDGAFVILVSGAAVSPSAQEVYRVTHELHHLTDSPVQIAFRVLIYQIQIFIATVLHTIHNVIPLSKILPRAAAFGVYLDWDFDVVPYLKSVTCPILAVYGEVDKVVPVQESAAILKEALKTKDFTMKIFPRANHALLESETGVWSEVSRMNKKEFVTGYYDLVAHWITDQVQP
jgi:hypothetical protein